MHKFKELEIWKRSRLFCSEIYSITSNIAEGSSRNSNKDFSRFLQITLGSAYEIETQLLIANDLNFITDSELKVTISELQEIIKMVSKFKSTLKF